MSYYYISMQYSAIQKTVLRHDRLWSIVGISNILSRLNEIEMPRIANEHNGTAIVAGGGKFTARFNSLKDAQYAKDACVALVATTLPMLEFQVTDKPMQGVSFQKLAATREHRNPILKDLSIQKYQLRGYATTYNPHLMLCEECGEYPVQETIRRGEKKSEVCRICYQAFEESRHIHNENSAETTLQKIYHGYLANIPNAYGKYPVADFSDLFPPESSSHNRMAVWFSDINNMNDKVPVWLKQDDEDKILTTFTSFRSTIVDIIVDAISRTFPKVGGNFFPFRLVVAGGDDLCLVMAEKNILPFARNLSSALENTKKSLSDSHPLSDEWLYQNGFDSSEAPKPFSFGASFIIASIHTPFSHIHQLGEELMSTAKKRTNRLGNSVNWRIMAEENATTETLLDFEKPLFIEKSDRGRNSLNQLTLADYEKLLHIYQGKPSGAQLQQIVEIMQQEKDPWQLERKLKLLDATAADKSFSFLLQEKDFRNSSSMLLPERITTFFELKMIAGGFSNE